MRRTSGYRYLTAAKIESAKRRWMAAFENSVNQLWPEHRGKICWDDAIHMRNAGMVHFVAAAKYVEAHKK